MVEHIDYQTAEMTNNLGSLGYGLLSRDSHAVVAKTEALGPEEAIIKVLTVHPDPRYIEGIPVIIAKNDIDYSELVELVLKNRKTDPHIPNKVGYFLDITFELFVELGINKDYTGLELTIEKMKKLKDPHDEIINPNFRNNKGYLKLVTRDRDEKMIYWNVLYRYDKDSFKKNLLLYVDKQEFAK